MRKGDAFEGNNSDPATELGRSVLSAVVDGDNDLLRGICALFLDSYPRLMVAIHDAIARNDGNALMRAAHTLQGSGGYLITDSSRKALVDLERMAHEGKFCNAGERAAELASELERLKPEVLKLAEEGLLARED